MKHVVLGVTGSIAAYKSGDIIRRLRENGCEVSVVMTRAAEEFITPLSLEALCGRPVVRDYFFRQPVEGAMPHITLAQTAGTVLVAPATASLIGKFAHGIADDLLICLLLATRAKILIAPAMNTEMYTNPVVQNNCRILKQQGVEFIDPVEGALACGASGQGHLADMDQILEAVWKTLK
jgi:phosphopantothenoylcysteine decarboxylase/phosphopantothenate--cysteine ligase